MSEAVPRRTRSQLTPITDPQTASARLRRSGFCIRALCEFFPITSRTRNPMIPALTLTNIVFTYPGTSEPLLDGSTVTFARGWTAVLGDNGIGKTTLAKLAIGRLSPDAGAYRRLRTACIPVTARRTPTKHRRIWRTSPATGHRKPWRYAVNWASATTGLGGRHPVGRRGETPADRMCVGDRSRRAGAGRADEPRRPADPRAHHRGIALV